MQALGIELKQHLMAQGATLVAFADLRALPEANRRGFPGGVSIAVALDPAIIAGIQEGPTREYYAEYRRVNALLDELSAGGEAFLKHHGFRALGFAATDQGIDSASLSTVLPHKTVATRAGLGWIGRCALLVTESHGSAVRLTTVLTDAPLAPGEPIDASRCGECHACVEVCPARAAKGATWHAGLAREAFYDAFACRPRARALAKERTGIEDTFCGMCISACPWTKRQFPPAND